jgi:hypothetical protein
MNRLSVSLTSSAQGHSPPQLVDEVQQEDDLVFLPARVGDYDTLGELAPAGSIALARPKSSTFTLPSARTLIFAGFRSLATVLWIIRAGNRDRGRNQLQTRTPNLSRAGTVKVPTW